MHLCGALKFNDYFAGGPALFDGRRKGFSRVRQEDAGHLIMNDAASAVQR